MINQSFSAENFEKIFNIENRRGEINKDFLPIDYIVKINEIKDIRKTASDLRIKYKSEEIDKETYKEAIASIDDKIETLQAQKEEILYEHMKNVSKQVNSPKFKFSFSVGERRGKSTYELGGSEAQYYAIKQLQYNVRKTFKVKQSDRYKSLKQIKLILKDGLPKIIIRTDISSFYESIPQDRLCSKIENDTLLTYQSKQFIYSILKEFESKRSDAGEYPRIGIPRGIGISAYLSELYIKDIDSKIKSINNVSFYSRYVDDIFIVITPNSVNDTYDYLNDISKIVTDHQLTLKTEKTEVIKIDRKSDVPVEAIVSYLGYKFIVKHYDKGVLLNIMLSDSKIDKYKERIKKTFDAYNVENKYNEREARKLLFNRLRFLTGNMNLINSKQGIKAGVYYSNSILNEDGVKKDLGSTLDGYIKRMVYSNLKPHSGLSFNVDKFKKFIINQFSFVKGFNELRFHKFSKDDFQKIKHIWDE